MSPFLLVKLQVSLVNKYQRENLVWNESFLSTGLEYLLEQCQGSLTVVLIDSKQSSESSMTSELGER